MDGIKNSKPGKDRSETAVQDATGLGNMNDGLLIGIWRFPNMGVLPKGWLISVKIPVKRMINGGTPISGTHKFGRE